MKQRFFYPRSKPAFSLIELLAAIAIVTVLCSIVLFSVSHIRDTAMQAQSASNLRQLAAANLTYSSEHATFCPGSHLNNLIRWHGARSRVGAEFDPTKGYLSPYLGKDGQIGMCPKLDALRSEYSSSASFESGTGGYGYNSAYLGSSAPNMSIEEYIERRDAELGTPPERIHRVEEPANTLMFATVAFPRADGLQEYASAEPYYHMMAGMRLSGADPSVHFRFDGKALVAWVDGHVSAEPPARIGDVNIYGGNAAKYQIGWVGPEEDNGYWNTRKRGTD